MLCLLLFFLLILSSSTSYPRRDSGKSNSPVRDASISSRLAHLLLNETLNIELNRHLLEKKSLNLLLFIGITSAPLHFHLREAVRNTWLLPCIDSEICNYRFFIDCFEDDPDFPQLKEEAQLYGDIVFRDSCALLLRFHPDLRVTYGNSAPDTRNLMYRGLKKSVLQLNGSLLRSTTKPTEVVESLPDYHYRRRYRIDWKVCNLQWIHDRFDSVEYYVLVEDDFFVCTDNLIYQLTLLQQRSKITTVTEFRTGAPNYEGFDDSSTIITKRLAQTFARHYLEPGFNCSNVFNALNESSIYLAWGNSWFPRYCNWTAITKEKFHFPVHRPSPTCINPKDRKLPDNTTRNGKNETVIKFPILRELKYPCPSRPLILHHYRAPKVILKEHSSEQIAHLCEYMLLIDKIKLPKIIYQMWELMSSRSDYRFHDFSGVFLNDGLDGWPEMVEKLFQEEQECLKTLKGNYSALWSTSKRREPYPCLFQRPF